MELRYGHHSASPAVVAERAPVHTAQEQQAGVRLAKTGEERDQSRFSAARGALEEQAIAAVDTHAQSVEHGLSSVGVAEGELVPIQKSVPARWFRRRRLLK